MNKTMEDVTPGTTMARVLEIYPGAQRALFRRYHVGGCSSCAFQPTETLEDLCRRHEDMDVVEVLAHLKTSREQDEQMLLAPAELAALMNLRHPLKLLDVRTREEWEAVRIEGAARMSRDTMQEILASWPREALLVICDHEGKQGLDAAAYFLGQGFKNVKCLRGGLDAWSREVDPKLPRYQLA
jgi:rhodanese-related sulfurtransferase